MRKILIAVAIAAFASYNVYRSNNDETEGMSDTMLANVEALAAGEILPDEPCYKGDYDSNLPNAVKCDHPCRTLRCGGAVDKCY